MALPLSVIVLVSMLKDAFEDYKRYKSDNEENSAKTHVYDPETGKFEIRSWNHIKPGQIVKVLEDEFIPADLITLNSSDPKGGLNIETKNLDGETHLKPKTVEKTLNKILQK